MTEKPAILWFRRDLRLSDNTALIAALKTGAPIIPLYIYDVLSPGIEPPGDASKWWLHKSLEALSISLKDKDQMLCLRRGPAFDVMSELLDETGAGAIFFQHSHCEAEAVIENEIAALAKQKTADCHRYAGELLFEPKDIKTGSGGPYKVFTPFWRACLEAEPPTTPAKAPKNIPGPAKHPKSDKLSDWGLLPTKPDWAKSFEPYWQPGEEGGKKALVTFLKGPVTDYKKQRDYPAVKGTSRLSPHLHFGEISPRQIWSAANDRDGAEAFLREIGWREFCYHLLHHWPELNEEPFREEFKAFPWVKNEAFIKVWQKGITGIPIIDAGMRELWQTGWMHNRVRMIVASFLTKNGLQHWHVGRDWFWDTLVDADLANNAAGWQWVAGSGADAAPYFRIFNPVSQSEKFDKTGGYIRNFVPEIKDLPDKYIHDPSNAPKEILDEAGIILGETYPKAILDLKKTRAAALKAYEAVKNEREEQSSDES